MPEIAEWKLRSNEDITRRNPFDFKLVDVEANDSQKHIAMTEELGGKYYVEKTKTECGGCFIPMTKDVCQSLKIFLLAASV